MNAIGAKSWSPGLATSSPRVASLAPPTGRFRWRLHIVGVPLLATALRVATTRTSPLAYLIAIGYALAGRRQAIVALFLCWLFNMTNHSLGGGPPTGAVFLRYGIYFAAAIGVLTHARSLTGAKQIQGILVVASIFAAAVAAHSLLFSPASDVSLLKLVTFYLVLTTLLGAWAGLDPSQRAITEQMIFGGLMLVAICSLPLVVTKAGYMQFGSLFKGVLVHSQSFGPTMAVLASFLTIQCLTLRPLKPWRLLMLLLVVALMLMSKARIALVAYTGGLSIGLIGQIARTAIDRYRNNSRIVHVRLLVAALVLGALVIIAAPKVAEFGKEFITKGRNVETLRDAAYNSRGILLERLLTNIRATPLTGIGFGVSSDPEDMRYISRDPIFGLPVMASIEKGIMPVAIIEELGIPLAMLAYLLLAMLMVAAFRGGLLPFTVFTTAMLTNLAESMFFSPGGMGMLILIICSWAATMPSNGKWLRLQRSRKTAQPNLA